MSIYSNIKSKPVSGRRLLGITFLFIVILLSVRWVWFNTITVPEERPFRQGVLDLRAWPADDRSRVALNGSGPLSESMEGPGWSVPRRACGGRPALDTGSGAMGGRERERKPNRLRDLPPQAARTGSEQNLRHLDQRYPYRLSFVCKRGIIARIRTSVRSARDPCGQNRPHMELIPDRR